MRLTYRGVHYLYEPTLIDPIDPTDTNVSDVSGCYRGHRFSLKYPRHIPVSEPALDLVYRGVHYRTTAIGGLATHAPTSVPAINAEVNSVAKSTAQAVPASKTRQPRMSEVANIHRQSIQRRLQHRIEVAKARGDQTLLQQLEQETQLFV